MSTRSDPQQTGRPLNVSWLFLLYGALHSVLASSAAKQAFAKLAGERARNGLYRPLYIGQAVLVTLAAVAAFLRLPDRDLYQVRKPWAWALNVVQAAGVGLLLRAVSVTGFDRMIGLPQLLAYGRGEHPAPEYEAQGPPPQALDHPERLGPFGWVSHPDNLPIILVVWAFPKMTVNRLTLALWATVYALVGSWHEDARLQGAYGEAFARYRHATPMLVPRFGRKRTRNG
jgi:hypothetical protein